MAYSPFTLPKIPMTGGGATGLGSIGGGGGLASFLSGPWGMALMALAPSLLGGLFKRGDPNRMARLEIQRLLDPWNIRKEGQEEFKNTLQSPGYSMARHETLQGGQNAMNLLNTTIGQRGLGRSGVGIAMPAAVTAGVGANLGRLSASAWDQAQNSARQMAVGRASTLAGMPVEPNYGANLFAGGLNALLPVLMKQFGGKDPNETEMLELLRRLLGSSR